MYGQHITISGPFASAVEKVITALKSEGIGVLSDIDIQKAMKEKLGASRSLAGSSARLQTRASSVG